MFLLVAIARKRVDCKFYQPLRDCTCQCFSDMLSLEGLKQQMIFLKEKAVTGQITVDSLVERFMTVPTLCMPPDLKLCNATWFCYINHMKAHVTKSMNSQKCYLNCFLLFINALDAVLEHSISLRQQKCGMLLCKKSSEMSQRNKGK